MRIVKKKNVNDTIVTLREKKQTVTYHVGFLFEDRMYDENVKFLANEMMSLQNRGFVNLVQRKLEPFVYEYIAIPTKAFIKRQGALYS